MAGNKKSVLKTRDTLLKKNPNYYKEIGSLGGRVKVPKGFAITGTGKEVAKKRHQDERRLKTKEVNGVAL